ncbi:MAG: hypothetical protein CL610_02770 [Anaerolineaceae bacterium]|nr:hypothetical protein [Anaerolineaceae bacterium]
MNTSSQAVQQLQQAMTTTRQAASTIENLIAEHDYQDVAGLVTLAAAALLESAAYLMQGQDEAALESLEDADDLLDAVYDIIESDLGDGD